MFVRHVYEQLLRERAQAVTRAVERAIDECPLPPALGAVLHGATTNGRRFRPLLLLVVHEGLGGDWSRVVDLAAAIELLHKASIVHDDLVDEDTARRGAPTLWSEHGSAQAVVAGDALVGLSLRTATQWLRTSQCERADDILETYQTTMVDLALGEMLDLQFEQEATVDAATIERMLRLKSGSLIAGSMKLGALAAAAPPTVVEALCEYGALVGVAFQMINDLNNVTGLDRHSKGDFGQDLARAKKTLATAALQQAGVQPAELAGLSHERVTELLAAPTAALEHTLEQAADALRKIADEPALVSATGQPMIMLLQKLLAQAREDWFWIDEDH